MDSNCSATVDLHLRNRDLNEKIENSRMRIEAIRKCYLLGLNCGSQPPRAGELALRRNARGSLQIN
jgi:hypothetical protein